MTTDQFNQSVNAEIKRMQNKAKQIATQPDNWEYLSESTQDKWMQDNAVQVCSAGDWPEDMGGNWTPDRREANIAFSDWLDQQGDSIVPESFSEWLKEDSIFIE